MEKAQIAVRRFKMLRNPHFLALLCANGLLFLFGCSSSNNSLSIGHSREQVSPDGRHIAKVLNMENNLKSSNYYIETVFSVIAKDGKVISEKRYTGNSGF